MILSPTVISREITAHQQLTVRLLQDGINRAIKALTGVEAGVQRTVRIDQGNTAAERPVVGSEVTANYKLIVRHHRNASDGIIGSRARIKGGIQGAIGVGAGDTIAAGKVIGEEVTHEHRFVVRLNRQTVDFSVGAWMTHLRRHRRKRDDHIITEVRIVVFIHGTGRRMIVRRQNGNRTLVHHAARKGMAIAVLFIERDDEVFVELLQTIIKNIEGNRLGVIIIGTPAQGSTVAAREVEVRDQTNDSTAIDWIRRGIV